jgi:hypothetical protein
MVMSPKEPTALRALSVSGVHSWAGKSFTALAPPSHASRISCERQTTRRDTRHDGMRWDTMGRDGTRQARAQTSTHVSATAGVVIYADEHSEGVSSLREPVV